ncbi:MAG: hypothetical protein IJS45_03270 [Clostridia bacterium]|nr:hypothetical protein [Clostridia bacterium]
MKNKTSVPSKLLSLVLVIMLAIPFGIMPTLMTSAAHPVEEEVTDAKLVADNYDLSDAEKALLTSGLVVGNSYELNAPDNSDNLISVDPVAKTVEAETFVDGEYTWNPVGARVVYNTDETEEFMLDDEGKGSFEYDGDVYTVEVDYEVEISVDPAMQALLLNGPYYIAKMVEYADTLGDNDAAYNVIASRINGLNNMVNSNYIQDSDTAAAIQYFYNQAQDNYDVTTDFTYLDIEAFIFEYMPDYYDGGIAYLYEHGSEFSDVARETYGNLAQISNDNQIKSLNQPIYFAFRNALNTLLNETEEASNNEWEALDPAKNPLKDELTANEYTTLGTLASNAKGAVYHEDEIKESLTAGKTTVSKNINQFSVNVIVEASYVADTTIDSATLTDLAEHTATVRVLDDATEADIADAVEAKGVEQEALTAWGIDVDNFNRTVGYTEATATSDAEYVIAYTPKNFSITYDFETDLPSTVPYGYNLRLPSNPNASLVYDYEVNGTEMYQGDLVKITSDTAITRTEGKPWSGYSLGKIIADIYADELTEDEIAALSSVANKTDKIRIRIPSNSDDLVSVTFETSGKYRVIADNFTESGIDGVIWMPVSGKALKNGAVVAEFEINGGAGEFDNSVEFDKVEVEYKTTLTNVPDTKTIETLNNIKLLEEDAATLLDEMATLDELYSKLGQLDKSALNKIKVAVKGTDMSDESRAAVEALLAGCVDKTGSLYLYEYLTQYHTDKLAYVYKNDQYLKIKEQADIVNANLTVIYNDPQLLPVLRDFDLEDYYEKFDEIVTKLSQVHLAPEHMDLVDTASPSIATLTSALEKLVEAEYEGGYETPAKALTLNATVTAPAPGLSTVTVKVVQKNSAGAELASKTDAIVLSATEPLTDADIAAVDTMINAILADLGIDTIHYVTEDAVGLEAGDVLANNASFVITYSPKVYTTRIVTSGQTIHEIQFFFDNPTITLPEAPNETVQYEYTTAWGKKITVSTDAKSLTFTTVQLDNGSYAEIERETLDAEREAFLALIKDMNKASADAGLLSGQNMIVSFIPFENAEGDMAVVLRFAPDSMSRKEIEDALMNMVEVIAGSDYNYIKMADEYIRYDSTASLQAIINVLLDSGICLDTYLNAVDENGDIIEWNIDSDYVVLGAEYVEGIEGKLIKVGNNARINDVEILGGYLMESDMIFSKGEDDPGKQIKLYVTFEDFDKRTSDLKDVRKAVKKVKDHGDIILHDGLVDVTVRIPERGFQAYYTAMAVLDNQRLWEGDLAEFDRAIELLNKAVDFLAADKTITTTTIENTAAKIDQDLDLSSIKDYFRNGIKALNHILDNVDYEIVNSEEGIYDANFHYDINKALDKAEVKDSIRSIIKEKDTGIEAAAKVTFTNTAPHYQAIIGDYQANGWDKFEYTQNLGAAAPRVHDNTMILLLDDYTGDLVFNSIAYIDLNGHTINGNIVSNSEVYILNNEFATKTDAGVTGTITGRATISGGRYNDDVSSKLEEGYIQDENGLVRGEYFFVYDKGDGNIEIHIDKEAEALGATGAIAYEIAFKYALHYYAGASLKIGDKTLYELKAEDLIAMYEGGLENAKDQIHDCVDEDAIRALGNDIKEAISDYVKDSHEVVSGEILATFPVEYNRFTFELKHVRNGDYITADIIPDADSVVAGGTVTIMAHEFEEPVIVEPYCETDGSETYVATCTDCDYTYVKELEALGHDPLEAVEENRIDASCTEAGSYDMVVYCDRCGEELSREHFTIDKLPHTPGDWEVSVEPTPTTVGEKVKKCTECGEILERKPYYYTIVPLQVIGGATVATAEVDNEARIITIITKEDAKKAAFNLKLEGAKNDAFTMTDEAFEAGNELQIRGIRYNRRTDALGIRYFVSEKNPGERRRTYDIEVITPEGDTVIYTVNITFAVSPDVLRDGVEPGVGSNAPLTGFDPDDGDIYLVSQPGREKATFRLYLPKGASVKVDSEAKPHLYQILDYEAKTYHEVDNDHIDPDWFVYFKSYKNEPENYEYKLCVTLANGEKIYHNVHVQFVD